MSIVSVLFHWDFLICTRIQNYTTLNFSSLEILYVIFRLLFGKLPLHCPSIYLKIKQNVPIRTERRKKSFVLANYLLIDSLIVNCSPSPFPVDTKRAKEHASKTPFFSKRNDSIRRSFKSIKDISKINLEMLNRSLHKLLLVRIFKTKALNSSSGDFYD